MIYGGIYTFWWTLLRYFPLRRSSSKATDNDVDLVTSGKDSAIRDRVTINVSGLRFETRLHTLQQYPDTLLRRPSQTESLLRSTPERIFLRPGSIQLRFDPVLLPEQRQSPSSGQRTCGRVRRWTQLLSVGRGDDPAISTGRRSGRGEHQATANEHPPAPHLDAAREPGELTRGPDHRDPVRERHHPIHRHVLSGDVTGAETISSNQRESVAFARWRRGRDRAGRRPVETERTVLHHRDRLHRLVHDRVHPQVRLLSGPYVLLQESHELDRLGRHRAVLYHPRGVSDRPDQGKQPGHVPSPSSVSSASSESSASSSCPATRRDSRSSARRSRQACANSVSSSSSSWSASSCSPAPSTSPKRNSTRKTSGAFRMLSGGPSLPWRRWGTATCDRSVRGVNWSDRCAQSRESSPSHFRFQVIVSNFNYFYHKENSTHSDDFQGRSAFDFKSGFCEKHSGLLQQQDTESNVGADTFLDSSRRYSTKLTGNDDFANMETNVW